MSLAAREIQAAVTRARRSAPGGCHSPSVRWGVDADPPSTLDAGSSAGTVERLTTWLISPDARAAAGAELRRIGLVATDAGIDDLLAEVAVRVLGRQRRSALSGEVVAYARVVLRNCATDLVRGAKVRLEELVADVPEPGVGALDAGVAETDTDPAVLVGEVDAAAQLLAAVRRTLLEADPRYPWVASAGLTVLLVAQHDELLEAATGPRPGSGTSATTLSWIGLSYAGRHDCFGDPRGDHGSGGDPACRKRRATAIGRLTGALADAFDACTPGDTLHGTDGGRPHG